VAMIIPSRAMLKVTPDYTSKPKPSQLGQSLFLNADRNDQRRAAVFVKPADAFLNQGEVQPGGTRLGWGFNGEVVARVSPGRGRVAGGAFAVEFEPAAVGARVQLL